MPLISLLRSYCSRFRFFLMTVSGMISTFSYVVNLLPQESHNLLRRMELVSSTGLESTTLVLSWLQYGHLIWTCLPPFRSHVSAFQNGHAACWRHHFILGIPHFFRSNSLALLQVFSHLPEPAPIFSFDNIKRTEFLNFYYTLNIESVSTNSGHIFRIFA